MIFVEKRVGVVVVPSVMESEVLVLFVETRRKGSCITFLTYEGA